MPAEVLPLIIRSEPDLVLLDIVMPHFNGLDLLEAIRPIAHLAHIPMVMLTALDDRETKCQALELGATDFLAKPVDPSELVSRVRNVLLVKAHHDHLRNHAADLERLVQRADGAAGGLAAERHPLPGPRGRVPRRRHRPPRDPRRPLRRRSSPAQLGWDDAAGRDARAGRAACTTSARSASPTPSCSSRAS